MVKSTEDKRKLSNWKENDVFALKIESTEYPKYNRKYLILIHCIIEKEDWKLSRTTNTFRVKITKDKKIPQTKEEIDKLEYIKTSYNGFFKEKMLFPNDTIDLKPDEYLMIYKYVFEVKSLKYKTPKELIYIGNFEIDLPQNEFIPYSQHYGILFCLWKSKYSTIINDLLKHYEELNLKKSEIYDKEFQERYYEKQIKEGKFWLNDREETKKLIELAEKGFLPDYLYKGNKKGSITYVGREEKDPSKSKK